MALKKTGPFQIAPFRGPEIEPQPSGRRRTQESLNPWGVVFRNVEQEERFLKLAKRRIKNTRYCDDDVLDKLGIRGSVEWLFGRVGMLPFLGMKPRTYKRVTLEFLSSLDISRGLNVTFRLFDTERSMSLDAIRQIFSFPLMGSRQSHPDFNDQSFWNDITHDYQFQVNYATTKASHICNPSFRYTHRILSNTIYARGVGSDGVVRMNELIFLFSMVEDHRIDVTFELLKHMDKVAKRSSGDIAIGGLITPIAQALDCHLARLEEGIGESRLDMERIINMHMVIKRGDDYFWKFQDNSLLRLPAPDRINVRNRANWRPRSDFRGEDYIDREEEFEESEEEREEETGGGDAGPSTSHPLEGGNIDRRILCQTLIDIQKEQRRQARAISRIQRHQDDIYQWHQRQGHFDHFDPPPAE